MRPHDAREPSYLWLALILAFAALLGAAACGKRPSGSPAEPLSGYANPYPSPETIARCRGKPLERKRCLEAE